MKDDRAYLLHIQDSIERIMAYTAGGRKAFLTDSKTQDAVVRNLEIIGEAAKKASSALKARHPGIPWKKMAGMRDKMIHEYFGVDLEIVWGVARGELPNLKKRLAEIVRKENKLQ